MSTSEREINIQRDAESNVLQNVLKEHVCGGTLVFTWRIVGVILAISLTVSAVSCFITGSVVYTIISKNTIGQDGGWSTWSTWSSCSATCDGGKQSRSRTCDNPTTARFGKTCDGANMEIGICNTDSCPAPVVVFAATTPSYQLLWGKPRFTRTVTNIGNGYNQTSGEFRCVVPGTYHFSVTLLLIRTGETYCFINHNNNKVAVARTYEESSEKMFDHSASASTYITLVVGDIVYLDCGGWENVKRDIVTAFNGALVASSAHYKQQF